MHSGSWYRFVAVNTHSNEPAWFIRSLNAPTEKNEKKDLKRPKNYISSTTPDVDVTRTCVYMWKKYILRFWRVRQAYDDEWKTLSKAFCFQYVVFSVYLFFVFLPVYLLWAHCCGYLIFIYLFACVCENVWNIVAPINLLLHWCVLKKQLICLLEFRRDRMTSARVYSCVFLFIHQR